jgi:hypothetical protein
VDLRKSQGPPHDNLHQHSRQHLMLWASLFFHGLLIKLMFDQITRRESWALRPATEKLKSNVDSNWVLWLTCSIFCSELICREQNLSSWARMLRRWLSLSLSAAQLSHTLLLYTLLQIWASQVVSAAECNIKALCKRKIVLYHIYIHAVPLE